MAICVRCYVAGQVQGVWFRASTQKKAEELGVCGWVCNLPDGRVEVLLQGETETVETLKRWLWQGPPLATVTTVQCETADEPNLQTFEVR